MKVDVECWLDVQDLKGKILVKGKKEKVVEENPSSSSDLDSSEEEGSYGKSSGKKDKKVV